MRKAGCSLILGALCCVAASAQSKQYLPTILQFHAQPVMVRSLYHDPSRLMTGAGSVAPNGAVAENAKNAPEVNVELQRWGADLLTAAMVNHTDTKLGIDVMTYGFQVEQPDGSFGKNNGFQALSFFLEASARTLLLLKQSRDPKYDAITAKYTPLLEKAAREFIADGDADQQDEKGKIFTHRYYLLAAMLGETAALTQDKELAAKAREYVQKALAEQLPDGTNPEKGGFDLNYGAASGLFAERYYSVCTDAKMRASIQEMLRKALAREALAVLPSGELSMADSTRTGKDAKHDNSGKPKGIDHKGVIPFFAIGAEVTGDAEYSIIAQKIAQNRGWWN